MQHSFFLAICFEIGENKIKIGDRDKKLKGGNLVTPPTKASYFIWSYML